MSVEEKQHQQGSHQQHAVPQNFMDVEFKLIGDLTIRQFVYLLVFLGLAYGAYATILGILKFPITAILGILGIGFAFVPIEERGMDQWLINFIRAVHSPTERMWRKVPVLPSAFMYQNLAVVKQELIALTPTSSRRKLEDYLGASGDLQGVDKLDMNIDAYVNKIRKAYGETPYPVATPSPRVSTVAPVTAVAVEEEAEEGMAEGEDVMGEGRMEGERPAPKRELREIPKVYEKKPSRPTFMSVLSTTLTPDRHAGRPFVSLVPSEGEIMLPIRGETILRTTEELDVDREIDEKAQQLQGLLSKIKTKQDAAVPEPTVTQPSPSTEMRPPVSAVFFQPSTGEGRSTEVSLDVLKNELDKKTQSALKAVRAQETREVQKEQEVTVESEYLRKEAQKIVDKVRAENIRLAQEIENLRIEIKQPKALGEDKSQKTQQLQLLEQTKQKRDYDIEALQTQIDALKQRLEAKDQLRSQQAWLSQDQPVSTISVSTERSASYSNFPTVNKPNVLSGLVKDPDGNAMTGTLIIIKNQREEPVRALKSNNLGQFFLSSPLSNGIYTIEIPVTKTQPHHFDTIFVEVKGKIVPPLIMVGKEAI